MHHLPSRYIPCDGRLTASAYFNPRFLHGERPTAGGKVYVRIKFQSTLPAWGATLPNRIHHTGQTNFNPRSPHGERLHHLVHGNSNGNFNPRSPHGERLGLQDVEIVGLEFQSTLPAWGATAAYFDFVRSLKFQSTLPAWGATTQKKQSSQA